MNRRKILFGCLIGLLLLLLVGGGLLYFFVLRFSNLGPARGAGGAADIQVPAGFEVTIFADGLKGPRFISFGPDGHLYVAERGNDRIVRLPDNNGDGRSDSIDLFAADLDQVHSLVYQEGAWYAGVPAGVIRLEDTNGDGLADARTSLIDNFLPPGQHRTRTVAFLPDGRLLVSAGSTCNVCQEEDPRRAAITIYDNPAGQNRATGERIYATGLRNAVGLAIHPQTGEVWATNNGRDLMGDDLPPETIHIVRDGNNFGWPFCHSGDIIDPDMGQPDSCQGVDQPVATFQAHTAPLGLAFYTGTTFPEKYHGDLFIAQHGSWNRSQPVGYAVARLPLDGSRPTGPVEAFATGWLKADDSADGRPVGVAVGPNGALYVSDDKGGIIYLIQYNG